MQTYKDYSPTQFDTKGLNCNDQQDWLVLPIGHNRDTSDPIDISNWEVAQKMLSSIDGNYMVARFGHWACGWFEIILVKPDTSAAIIAHKIEEDLEIYPILDEDHLSEVELDAELETWNSLSLYERIELCKGAGVSIFAARHDYPPSDDCGYIRESRRYCYPCFQYPVCTIPPV